MGRRWKRPSRGAVAVLSIANNGHEDLLKELAELWTKLEALLQLRSLMWFSAGGSLSSPKG